MSALVNSIQIEDVLKKLRQREWLIPQFQREFVWSVNNVIELVNSILGGKPIGMVTLWEQPSSTAVPLEPIALPDIDQKTGKRVARYFATTEQTPQKVFAVIDGRQRCTAIAMAFGGFFSHHGTFRFSGRYFLNVAEENPADRVVFIKHRDVIKRGFDKEGACIAHGHFPLSSYRTEGEDVFGQWMRYLQALKDPANYANGKLPSAPELARRDTVLKQAFDGLIKTQLAYYLVPDSYGLAEIAEIFETLNTTGTKVSTVDLIHSWLFQDSLNDGGPPIDLRDWIYDLGQKNGAIGWSTQDRPELIAQIVTATHIALRSKPAPRNVGSKRIAVISSVKSEDLLALPTAHWRNVMANADLLASFIGDFQNVVAGGFFPYTECPYPVTSAIYVALRWHARFDEPESHLWGQDDLNAVFRAFFWRNALTTRYDQGFLTQLGADLKEIQTWLDLRKEFESSSKWAAEVGRQLDNHFKSKIIPTGEDLTDVLTDGRPGGAMEKALALPMVARARRDLLNANVSLAYPEASEVEMHHIYPRDWCKNNAHGALAAVLDKERAGRDFCESIVNRMPLSRESNNLWKANNPAQFIDAKGITYNSAADILARSFIDGEAFEYLKANQPDQFWRRRATLIADDLLKRLHVII